MAELLSLMVLLTIEELSTTVYLVLHEMDLILENAWKMESGQVTNLHAKVMFFLFIPVKLVINLAMKDNELNFRIYLHLFILKVVSKVFIKSCRVCIISYSRSKIKKQICTIRKFYLIHFFKRSLFLRYRALNIREYYSFLYSFTSDKFPHGFFQWYSLFFSFYSIVSCSY